VLKCTHSAKQVMGLKINTTNKKRSGDGSVDFMSTGSRYAVTEIKAFFFFFSFNTCRSAASEALGVVVTLGSVGRLVRLQINKSAIE